MLSVRADGQALGMPESVVVQSGTATLRGLLWRPSVCAKRQSDTSILD
jgi:hypothetical protein